MVATAPLLRLLSRFFAGAYGEAHPFPSDMLLHVWLRLTGSRMELLRIPAIVFYIIGLAALAASAGRLGGRSARSLLLWIAVLWPYGFHFGRVAGWYELSFLSITLLTLTFVAAADESALRPWLWFALAGLLAIYSNLYAWAVLTMLLVEVAVRRKRELWVRFTLVLGVLAIAYAPVWAFLFKTARDFRDQAPSIFQTILLCLYHLYAVLVSESVAPWFLPLSVPALLAIMAAALILTLCARGLGRRMLVYLLVLLVGMAVANAITTKRILMLTPWLLLGLALSAAEIADRRARAGLLVSLAVIAAIGWAGIAARKFYAAPHFIEPWRELAAQLVPQWRSGAMVVSNNGPFLFYLAYAAGKPWTTANWSPHTDEYFPPLARVMTPTTWRKSAAPIAGKVWLVTGVNPFAADDTAWAQQQLESRCTPISLYQAVPDSGYVLKQKLFPMAGQLPWRVQVRAYECSVR